MSKIRKIRDILSVEEKREMQKVIENANSYRAKLAGNSEISDKQVDEMCCFMENYEGLCIVVESLVRQEDELKEKRTAAVAKYNDAKNNAERDRALKEFTKIKNDLGSINEEYNHYESRRKELEEKALEYDRIILQAIDRVENKEKNRVADDNTPAKPKRR